MYEEKKFRTRFLGYKKSDVLDYLETLIAQFEEKLKEKEAIISSLNSEISKLKEQNQELIRKNEALQKEHQDEALRISSVLIKAQENAEKILAEAQKEAEEESRRLQQQLEEERERLVNMKESVLKLRNSLIDSLDKFEEEAEEVIRNAG